MPLSKKQMRSITRTVKKKINKTAASTIATSSNNSSNKRKRVRRQTNYKPMVNNIGRNPTRFNAPSAQGFNADMKAATGQQIYDSVFIPVPKIGNEIFESHVIDLRPDLFPVGNRMELLYGRWKFRRLQYKFVSQTPSNIGGTVWFCLEPGSQAELPTSFQDAQRYTNFHFHNVWHSPRNWNVLPRHLTDRWFTAIESGKAEKNPFDFFINHSPARLIFGTNGVTAPNSTVGFLQLQATIDFRDKSVIPGDHLPKQQGIEMRPPIGETVVRGDVKVVEDKEGIELPFPLPELPPIIPPKEKEEDVISFSTQEEDDEFASLFNRLRVYDVTHINSVLNALDTIEQER